MKQEGVLKQQGKLSDYKETIQKYLPCVLIKCVKYTNSRRLAEVIAFYTFTGAYRLLTQSGGANKIPVLIDSMLTVVGPDFADRPGRSGFAEAGNNGRLFENVDELHKAKKLADINMERCISRVDGLADCLDRRQLERITVTVMNYLMQQDGAS